MIAHQHAGVARVATSVILTFLTFALLAPARAQGVTTGRAGGPQPIYIGQIVPLTGGVTTGGPSAREFEMAGAALAVRQINAHGGINGRPLRLVLADDRATNSGAIAAFQWLATSRHVTAIIGPVQSSEIQAMTPYIKRAAIPVMIGGTAPILTHEGDAWVFRTRPSSTYEARVLTTFAVTTLHLTKFALLHANTVAGWGADAELVADLKARGLTPLSDQSFTDGTTDLTAQVLAIKKANATALISYFSAPDSLLPLAREMHQVGVHLTWLGSSSLGAMRIRLAGGALLYNTYVAEDYAPGQSPEANAFARASEATFHLSATFEAAYVYDGLQILAMVMRQVGTSNQAIRQGILGIKGYRGVEGTYTFDRNGDGLHQDAIVQNVQGRLRVIKVFTF